MYSTQAILSEMVRALHLLEAHVSVVRGIVGCKDAHNSTNELFLHLQVVFQLIEVGGLGQQLQHFPLHDQVARVDERKELLGLLELWS